MDTPQWIQDNGVVENSNSRDLVGIEKKARPPKEQQALNCPRCNSVNTKFCYYNNYSLSQPRYLCKTCRRYWTSGGSLRNVPVGGGSRKNRRSSSSTSRKAIQNLSPPEFSTQDSKIHEGHDLNLGYNTSTSVNFNGISEFVDLPFYLDSTKNLSPHNPNITIPMPISHDSNLVYSNGFSMHELKPSLNFSIDGVQNGYVSLQGVVQDYTNSSKHVFPFEDLKTNYQSDQERGGGEGNGYWNGMLAEGSW